MNKIQSLIAQMTLEEKAALCTGASSWTTTPVERLGIPEMTSFVAAIIQSEQLGVSMAKVLRIQSDQMRVKRRQRAEEEAHKAPVKMLIPMALLIFPSIMIIILTPAAIQIMGSGI